MGVHNEKRSSWGHSLVISPWGEILQEASGEWHGEPEVLIADIDQKLVEEKRKGLPQARRTLVEFITETPRVRLLTFLSSDLYAEV